MIKPFDFYFDFISPYSFFAHKEIKKIVNESAEFAKASPEPELDELYTDIYA